MYRKECRGRCLVLLRKGKQRSNKTDRWMSGKVAERRQEEGRKGIREGIIKINNNR